MKRNLLTVWGEKLGDKPLTEYPRPQFKRDSYVNLNGLWKYAMTNSDEYPAEFDGDILVPFSPECALSRVNKILKPDMYLHYYTEFTLMKNFFKGRVILHFGAVDSTAKVYFNGLFVGSHKGGYNAFSFDVGDAAKEGKNTLYVTVTDSTDSEYSTYGKQCSKRGGIWYTGQSGIWQTVWLESVPEEYIKGVKITPLFDEAKVRFELDKNFDGAVTVTIKDGENVVAVKDGAENLIEIDMPKDFVPWSPENPHLYDVTFISRRDLAESYFGMRKFSVMRDGKGYLRLALNNKPYFHNGLLDQGYWSDGMYTAPGDEALIYDIEQMKELGFNMLRKHIKVEPLRWYYHCDRLGMLVWQDMPSGGKLQNKWETLYLPYLGARKLNDRRYKFFGRGNPESRKTFLREYEEMIDLLYNTVSLSVWVPFNEGWGQFDAADTAEFTKKKDPYRIVDHASGWHDRNAGDVNSMHVYFKAVKLVKDKNRAVVLSEFGGYGYKDEAHCFNPDRTFGYKNFETREQYTSALVKLYRTDVIPKIAKGLSAAVYTELSDVEDEINGILTYDRKVLKPDAEAIKIMNAEVKL